MTYRFVHYHPKYNDGIINLQTGLWSSDLTTNSAYLAWKYEQNPYLNKPLIYLALENNHVVAMRGFHGAQWKIGESGQIITLPCAGDTIIAPEHRGRGLLRQMVQYESTDSALTAFPYALSFSTTPLVYFCLLSEAWQSIGAYNTLARISPIEKFYRLKKWVHQRKATVSRFWRAAAIQTSLESRVEDMATLVARTAQPGKIRQHKDSRFYAWRYRSPLSRYQFFYWQEAALEGFLVVRRPHHPTIGPVQLVDWAATDSGILTALLEAALHDAGFGGTQIWSATLPQAMVAALAQRGFRPAESSAAGTEYRPSILARRLKATPGDDKWSLGTLDLTDLENWELRMTCSDQY
jgi:GNAT superfamily N-acetyltransferase